jgi:hypothetical protein
MVKQLKDGRSLVRSSFKWKFAPSNGVTRRCPTIDQEFLPFLTKVSCLLLVLLLLMLRSRTLILILMLAPFISEERTSYSTRSQLLNQLVKFSSQERTECSKSIDSLMKTFWELIPNQSHLATLLKNFQDMTCLSLLLLILPMVNSLLWDPKMVLSLSEILLI